MLDALENGIGLDVVLWFQNHRFALLEIIAKVLDFAGEELFYIAILGLIFWMLNKKLGIRMLMMLVIINTLVFFFKDLLGGHRPYQVSPLVHELFEDMGNGIPSGHTASSLALWGYFAWWFKRREITIAVVLYVILQGIFRMVAGVHFPQDIVGGLILGGITLALYIPLAERFAEHWAKWSVNIKLALSLGIALGITLIVIAFVQDPYIIDGYLTLAGLLLGFGLGVIFEELQVNFAPHPELTRRVIQYILGLAATVAVLFVLKAIFGLLADEGILADILRVIRYAAVGFMALGLWPFISVKLGLMRSESAPDVVTAPA